MANLIKNGTLMIREGTSVPESLTVNSEPYSEGWRLVTNHEGYGLARSLSEAGWTFMYMAGRVTVTVFGFGLKPTLRKGFKRILSRTESPEFNCLEITEAVPKKFLGLFYLRICGHARNIQARSAS